MKTLHNKALIAILAAAATLWSCSADDPEPGSAGEAENVVSVPLIINVALPQQSRTDIAGVTSEESGTTSDPTAEEMKISNIVVMAFAEKSGSSTDKASDVTTNFNVTDQIFGTSASAYQIKLNLNSGKYRLFLVANVNPTELASAGSASALKSVVRTYAEKSSLQPGNLPMVYEHPSLIEISDNNTVVNAKLEMACAKVVFNVLFDRSIEGAKQAFGSGATGDPKYGLRIKGVHATNVSKLAPLFEDGGKRADAIEYDCDGAHYGADAFTYTPSNATTSADVMAVTGAAFNAADNTVRDKWLYRTVLYLPERYAGADDAMTRLDFEGEIFTAAGVGTAGAVNRYSCLLGHRDASGQPLKIVRNTYYEVVATVKGHGEVDLNTFVSPLPWGEMAIGADIEGNWLNVTKAEVWVNPRKADSLVFASNNPATAITAAYASATKIQDKPVVLFEKDNATQQLTIRINPAITLDGLTEAQRQGDVQVSLKSGNITKYILVHYDLTPMFEVDNTEFRLEYQNTEQAVANVTTNLTGVTLGTTTLTLPNGQTVSITTTAGAGPGEYRVVMTLNGDPEVSSVHTYDIWPKLTAYKAEFLTHMKVTVTPRIDRYRIYMRAINDRQHYNGGSNTDEFMGVLSEGGANNWNDGWTSWNNNTDIAPDNHRIYVYYQKGDNAGNINDNNVWVFSADSHAEAQSNRGFNASKKMTGDIYNPGWYYWDLSHNKTAYNVSTGASDRKPLPGETLIIFHNYTYLDKGYTLHRFNHHMDPGITLFDYEDCEGWYLYDPTSDPYFRYYDDKPVIKDVTFTVYTKKQVGQWKHTYGVAEANNPFTIWKNVSASESVAVGSWYKTTITLKCAEGDYEKAIGLYDTSYNLIAKPLFGGADYSSASHVGYYDGTAWHKGKPSGV